MKGLISIIVPIYKVEKYLEYSVESILKQTYSNLEVILVDDGSPDRCGKICDSFKEKDKRIKVIHQENKGLSAARNNGMKIATGDFIGFVDSDDYIHPQMFEVLYESLVNTDADISVCNFSYSYDCEYNIFTAQHFEIDSKSSIYETTEEKRKYIYIDKYLNAVLAWNKLYKKVLFSDICFPEGRIYEDEATTYKLLYKAKKIVYIEKKLYYYNVHESSITGQAFSNKRLLRLTSIEDKIKFYLEKRDWLFFLEALFVYKTDLLVVTSLIEKESEYKNSILRPYKKKYNYYCLKYIWRLPNTWKNKATYLTYVFLPKTYYKRVLKLNRLI